MTFPRPYYLSEQQICALFSAYDPGAVIKIFRIRYKNHIPIKTPEFMLVADLQSFILESFQEEEQPGGDLEVFLEPMNKTLFGHHDGVYWLEPSDG